MKSKCSIKVTYTVNLELTETEARALEAMVGYGTQSFLDTFYKMGTYYMKPYESGIFTLFESVKNQIRPSLYKVDCAKKAINEEIKKQN